MPKYNFYDFNIYFKFINSKIDEFEKKVLKEEKVPLTHREFSYVALVGNYPSTPLTKLIDKDSITKSTFSNQVKTLVAREFLAYKKPATKDSREKHLELTAKGRAVFEIYRRIRREFFSSYLVFLSEEERQILFDTGLKMTALLLGEVGTKSLSEVSLSNLALVSTTDEDAS